MPTNQDPFRTQSAFRRRAERHNDLGLLDFLIRIVSFIFVVVGTVVVWLPGATLCLSALLLAGATLVTWAKTSVWVNPLQRLYAENVGGPLPVLAAKGLQDALWWSLTSPAAVPVLAIAGLYAGLFWMFGASSINR